MTNHLLWFSAAVRLDVVIQGTVTRGVRSVFTLRARGFDEALARAVHLGRMQESSYLNVDRQEVKWVLVEVETVDELGDAVTDGREIYSEPIQYGDMVEYQPGPVSPEESRPGQSGV